MMAGFVRPDDGYAVYEKVGLFYMEEEGFFACMSTVNITLFRGRDIKYS